MFENNKQIRFHHCDPAGIVFYPEYFVLFNELVEDWFNEGLGVDFSKFHMVERLGFPAVKIECEFLTPSRPRGQADAAPGGKEDREKLHDAGNPRERRRYRTCPSGAGRGVGITGHAPRCPHSAGTARAAGTISCAVSLGDTTHPNRPPPRSPAGSLSFLAGMPSETPDRVCRH